MNPTKKLVYLALLTGQSLALFLLEGLIPLPFLAPGAKLGLANLITLIALCTLPRWQDAAIMLTLRIALSSLLGGGPTIFLYSLSGGLMSFAAMLLLQKSGRFSLIGISCAGGFCHHIGQLITASLIIGSPHLFLYLPILGPCGLVTGFLLGWTAAKLLVYIK